MLSLAITWSAIFGLPVIWCLAAAILNSSPLEFAGAFLSLIVWVPGLILFGEGSNFKKRWLADFLIASALGELTTIAVIAGVLSFCGYAYLMVGGLGATLLSGIGVFAVCMRLMRARALRAEIEVAHSTWAARQTTDTSSTETPAPPSPRPPE